MGKANRVAPAVPQRGRRGEGGHVVTRQPVPSKQHGEIRQRLLELNPTHLLGRWVGGREQQPTLYSIINGCSRATGGTVVGGWICRHDWSITLLVYSYHRRMKLMNFGGGFSPIGSAAYARFCKKRA